MIHFKNIFVFSTRLTIILGWFDVYNLDSADYLSLNETDRPDRSSISTDTPSTSGNSVYHFRFKPQNGLLSSLKPLLPGQEFTLSFDRASADLSLISLNIQEDDPMTGKVLALKNPYLTAEYISSPFLRNYFSGVKNKDISYCFDEVSVYHKSLPLNDNIIRFPNILGGNTPSYIFAGIISSDALKGSLSKSGTLFKRYDVTEFELTLNGFPCNGFPITNIEKTPIDVYDKFLTTTKRKFKTQCPEQLLPGDFSNFHFIFAHQFEGEQTESGWVGINLKLATPYKENFTLVIWTVNDVELKIDQYNRVEKLML